MEPENLFHIRRNIHSFSFIVIVLSVLVGASSWTFLGSRIAKRNERVDSLKIDTTRLALDLRTLRGEFLTLQHQRDSLESLLSSSDEKALLEEIRLIKEYLEEMPENAKAAQLNLYADRRVLEHDASRQSEDLLYAAKSALIKAGSRIEVLELDLKKAQIQQPGGGSTPNPSNVAALSPTATCDAEAKLKSIRKSMEVGLNDRLQLTINTLNERYFKKGVSGSWDKDKTGNLFSAYKDLVETIDRTAR